MKKILLIIILCFPFIVNADCNRSKHSEYIEYASRIGSDSSYSKSSGTFKIKLYNVLDDMVVKYKNIEYKVNSQNEVTIEDVLEGTSMSISIFAKDGCDEIRIININTPYYNRYYGSELCRGYEDKLLLCSSSFTTVRTSEEMIKKAKENYDRNIISDDDTEEKTEEKSFYDKLLEFGLNWGIKIVLFVITVVISSAFYNTKLRKIKHGI